MAFRNFLALVYSLQSSYLSLRSSKLDYTSLHQNYTDKATPQSESQAPAAQTALTENGPPTQPALPALPSKTAYVSLFLAT